MAGQDGTDQSDQWQGMSGVGATGCHVLFHAGSGPASRWTGSSTRDQPAATRNRHAPPWAHLGPLTWIFLVLLVSRDTCSEGEVNANGPSFPKCGA